jgi:predicted nucleic acid-binding protein
MIATPTLPWLELACIALRKMVIHPKQKDQILNAFQLGRHLAIELVEVDQTKVNELGRKAGLTSYDLCYLWLAIHLGGELFTLDKKLMKAASQQY